MKPFTLADMTEFSRQNSDAGQSAISTVGDVLSQLRFAVSEFKGRCLRRAGLELSLG